MFSFPEAAHFLGARLVSPKPSCYASGASVDSRIIEPGNLFVALESPTRDGHQFLEDAFRRGASGAVIDEKKFMAQQSRFLESTVFQNLIIVPNPLTALTQLSKWHRMRMNTRCVGITGSVGKTTTKDFLHYLLKKNYPVIASRGNFNNYLGLPLTLLNLQTSDKFCIAELGANHCGEIRQLAETLLPNAAIITGVSPAHLKGFGTLDAIYDAKLELLENLSQSAPAILPASDALLLDKASRFKVKPVTVGIEESAHRRISNVKVKNGRVSFSLDDLFEFSFPGVASFVVQNAAMAVVMAESLGISLSAIDSDWNDFCGPRGRFAMKDFGGGVKVIDDSYNANPYSFQKALEAFANYPVEEGKRILVFSDMLELGAEEMDFHLELGEEIAKHAIDMVFAYGPLAEKSIVSLRNKNSLIRANWFESCEELSQNLKGHLKSGDVLLLKASRGMSIEKVLEQIRPMQTN